MSKSGKKELFQGSNLHGDYILILNHWSLDINFRMDPILKVCIFLCSYFSIVSVRFMY